MELNQAIAILRDAKFQKKWIFWESGTNQKLISDALACLESTPSEAAIPQMAYLLWGGGSELRTLLEPLFLQHALAVPSEQWFRVDEEIRRWTHHWSYPQEIDEGSQKKAMAGSTALILIGLCQASGYVRQRAMKLTLRLPRILCEALLVVRVNDWVKVIRNAAASKLELLLPQLTAAEKMQLAPLLWELRLHTRHRSLDMIDSWERIIAYNLDLDAWSGAWEKTPRTYRKALLAILKKSNASLSFEICKTILSSNDRGAIIWVICEVLPTMEMKSEEDASELIRRCKAVPVRREWLSYQMESKRGDTSAILRAALLDTSCSIRRVAQYYAGLEQDFDFLAFYREALKHPETEAKALYGMAETASQEAYQEAVMRLSSSVPAILKAAIFALPSETLGQHVGMLVNAVQSNLPGVSKAARLRLEERIKDLGAEIVASPDRWNGFSFTFQKLMFHWSPRFSKWDGLEFLLDHLEDLRWQNEAIIALNKWDRRSNASFVKLPSARRERLAKKVAVLSPLNTRGVYLRKLLARAE